jgi:hypothetical protein
MLIVWGHFKGESKAQVRIFWLIEVGVGASNLLGDVVDDSVPLQRVLPSVLPSGSLKT